MPTRATPGGGVGLTPDDRASRIERLGVRFPTLVARGGRMLAFQPLYDVRARLERLSSGWTMEDTFRAVVGDYSGVGVHWEVLLGCGGLLTVLIARLGVAGGRTDPALGQRGRG